MASNLNYVVMTGNLTRDPELRESKSGTSIVNFTIANNRYAGQDRDDRVNFVDCVAFGKRAEAIAEYFSKGSRILVEGELNHNTWENDEGEKRSKIEIWVNGFEFVGGGKNDEGGGSKGGAKKKRSTKKKSQRDDDAGESDGEDEDGELF